MDRNTRKRDFGRAIGWVFIAVVGAIFWTAFGFGLATILN